MASPAMLDTLRAWARRLKQEVYVLYLAHRDPRVPFGVKLLAAAVVAYAFSPIDLIPDFIPVLGYLDDLLLVPLGIWLVVRLMPSEVLEDCRAQAEALRAEGKPVNRVAGMVIVAVWLTGAAWLGWVAYRWYAR